MLYRLYGKRHEDLFCGVYFLKESKRGKISDFFNDTNVLENITNINIESIERYKWCLLLWNIENETKIVNIDNNQIILYKDKIKNAFLSEDFETKSNLLYCYGSIPIKCYMKTIINLIETILKDEEINKFKRFNIVFYLNLVRVCIGIRFIDGINLEKTVEIAS